MAASNGKDNGEICSSEAAFLGTVCLLPSRRELALTDNPAFELQLRLPPDDRLHCIGVPPDFDNQGPTTRRSRLPMSRTQCMYCTAGTLPGPSIHLQTRRPEQPRPRLGGGLVFLRQPVPLAHQAHAAGAGAAGFCKGDGATPAAHSCGAYRFKYIFYGCSAFLAEQG